MPVHRIVVSLDQAIVAKVKNVALEMGLSRSQVVELALKEFLRRRENERLLEQMNAALDGLLMTDEDKASLEFGRRQMRKLADPWEG